MRGVIRVGKRVKSCDSTLVYPCNHAILHVSKHYVTSFIHIRTHYIYKRSPSFTRNLLVTAITHGHASHTQAQSDTTDIVYQEAHTRNPPVRTIAVYIRTCTRLHLRPPDRPHSLQCTSLSCEQVEFENASWDDKDLDLSTVDVAFAYTTALTTQARTHAGAVTRTLNSVM